MNRSITTQTAPSAVAVAGPDIDQSLLRSLDQGDKVMMEVNGVRLYNNSKCPLVAETPWEVVSNEAPTLGQRPTKEHKLVLAHPMLVEPIELFYSNLLNLPRRQPAVFTEQIPQFSSNKDGSVNTVIVILQLISHYIPQRQVNRTFKPYDPTDAQLTLGDVELRELVLTEWSTLFAKFNKAGWGQKSVFRTALRAFVTPSQINAITRGFFEQLTFKELCRIHEVLYWLPCYLEQSSYAIERDVYLGGSFGGTCKK